MPDAKEAGLRDVHRGMDGKPIAGTDESGTRVTFGASRMPAPRQGPTPSGATADKAFPKPSGMTTGNAAVKFKSAAERGAEMNDTMNRRVAAVNAGAAAVKAQAGMPKPGIVRQSSGAPGGLITDGAEHGSKKLSSVFGTGAARREGLENRPTSAVTPSAVMRTPAEGNAVAAAAEKPGMPKPRRVATR
jgi:hypothetical protein